MPLYIRIRTKQAMRKGGSKEESMKPIWAAAEMYAGATYVHAITGMNEMDKH